MFGFNIDTRRCADVKSLRRLYRREVKSNVVCQVEQARFMMTVGSIGGRSLPTCSGILFYRT